MALGMELDSNSSSSRQPQHGKEATSAGDVGEKEEGGEEEDKGTESRQEALKRGAFAMTRSSKVKRKTQLDIIPLSVQEEMKVTRSSKKSSITSNKQRK